MLTKIILTVDISSKSFFFFCISYCTELPVMGMQFKHHHNLKAGKLSFSLYKWRNWGLKGFLKLAKMSPGFKGPSCQLSFECLTPFHWTASLWSQVHHLKMSSQKNTQPLGSVHFFLEKASCTVIGSGLRVFHGKKWNLTRNYPHRRVSYDRVQNQAVNFFTFSSTHLSLSYSTLLPQVKCSHR